MENEFLRETIGYLTGKPSPFVVPATALTLGIQDEKAAINATIGYALRKSSAYARQKCTCGACTWPAHGKANWA